MTRSARAIGVLICGLHATVLAATPTADAAWIALGPPGSAACAGYLTLHNPGPTHLVLTAVSSPAFASVELHRTERVGDSMRMRPVPKLEVAPQASVALAPGGTHLMLFAPRVALAAGQRIALALRFADGTTLTVDAEVRDPRAAAAPHAHAGTH